MLDEKTYIYVYIHIYIYMKWKDKHDVTHISLLKYYWMDQTYCVRNKKHNS